jgi:beta-aspartyl-peptidase (threonine type)
LVRKSNFGIVVHGGAGSVGSEVGTRARREFLRKSVSTGYEVLRRGGSSLDAVEEAIKVLEDSGIFNAGSGSCLTVKGGVEPDAAIMKGDLSCGAVANASIVRNPISLARSVMEKSDHVLIAGAKELEQFARAIGFPLFELKPSAVRQAQFNETLAKARRAGMNGEWPLNSKLKSYFGTVGAVAIDSRGELCSGVSTGGRAMKLPGRVGDSAIVGAGIYADEMSGAACATGAGEEILRVSLCKSAGDFMRFGLGAQDAADAAISLISRRRGLDTAGIIAIDRFGGLGISRNTQMMPHSYQFASMRKVVTGGFSPTGKNQAGYTLSSEQN